MESNERNVFVVALSTFNTQNGITKYQYSEQNNKFSQCSFMGYYQLTPIPELIKNYYKINLTHAILLETDETKKSIQQPLLKDVDALLGMLKNLLSMNPKALENSGIEKDNEIKKWLANPEENISAAVYYHLFLKALFPGIEIFSIDVNLNDFSDLYKKVHDKINDLYEDFTKRHSSENWHLYFDTHGGLRDFSSVFGAVARILETRSKNPIHTSIMLSAIYDPETKISEIRDETIFYMSGSLEPLKSSLDYDQYLSAKFTPYEGDQDYCFISYRHSDDIYEIREIFKALKNNDIKFWYDNGLKIGEKWDDQLKNKAEGCRLFILLSSPNYYESPECWKEVIRVMHKEKTICLLPLHEKDIKISFKNEADLHPADIKEAVNRINKSNRQKLNPEKTLKELKDYQRIKAVARDDKQWVKEIENLLKKGSYENG